GKLLVTRFDNRITVGRIVETEAYNGIIDKASHAFGGRRTTRTEIMYSSGGVAYVYFCYGMHHLFNIVTGKADVPHAVLIRALEPLEGIEVMLQRRGKTQPDHALTKGPGSVAQAMGISTLHTGLSLQSSDLYLADDGMMYEREEVIATPRIGVAYAGEDALLPCRFLVKGNQYVSGKKNQNLG
ncbi:MAG TPA: DNA-3-methyladenine glycosylase, partial [Phnomibacter sp.]|nr:DNA-3-methyladenine glycosylase [Phnomibacter sp.]